MSGVGDLTGHVGWVDAREHLSGFLVGTAELANVSVAM